MPRHKQFDTDDVLMKAMDLFWRQGYQTTSMQGLAKVMGLGRASIYSEFGSFASPLGASPTGSTS